MKSEHRHELKSNELADWLTHLPEWAKENLSSIIIVIVAIVVIVGFYGFRSLSQNANYAEQAEFSQRVENLLAVKSEIVSQQMARQTSDLSYILLSQATDMEKFAGSTSNSNMAAMALIKSADAIRSELQYHHKTVDQKDLVEKVNKAKKDYSDALAKKPSDKTVKALAEFGLGLCEEELGNYDEAKNIYKGLVDNAEFEGSVVVSKAKWRLEIMDEFENDVVFEPAPIEPAAIPDFNDVLDPFVEQIRGANIEIGDSNVPSANVSDANSTSEVIESSLPVEANLPTEITISQDSNSLEN